MRRTTRRLLAIAFLAISTPFALACATRASECGTAPSPRPADVPSAQPIDLAASLGAGRLRTVNREATVSGGGTAVRVTAAPGLGVTWIADTDFADGTIEADVCGRDVYGASFVGLAFHRQDDRTFEAVYLRPFNFRAGNAERRQHAVQYAAEPDLAYAQLRAKFPGEFEHAVGPAVVPTAWIPLRVVVHDGRVRVFVGQDNTPTLDVRELRTAAHGLAGLYVDNGSDGVFANVRILHGF